VFGEAKKMMSVSSACADMVSWVLLPEVDRMLSAYADEFIKEIQNQVLILKMFYNSINIDSFKDISVSVSNSILLLFYFFF